MCIFGVIYVLFGIEYLTGYNRITIIENMITFNNMFSTQHFGSLRKCMYMQLLYMDDYLLCVIIHFNLKVTTLNST